MSSGRLKTLAKGAIPPRIRRALHESADAVGAWWKNHHRERVQRKARTACPGSVISCLGYRVRMNDGPNFAVLYNDIVMRRIYDFHARCPDPHILDCGSNIGMSILFFKHLYPDARIVGFEPDPAVLPYLKDNLFSNGMTDVQIVEAAVGGKEGSLTFYSDAKYGSCLAHLMPGEIPQGWIPHQVPCVRLGDYLKEPVDFMKMNIEGAEWEALEDSGERLRNVREMAIEYHHLPGLPRTLHKILSLLHDLGFEYVVSDFDLATYSGARPPIRLTPETNYFRHIYAAQKQ